MHFQRFITYSILSLVALGGFFGSVHIETVNQGHSIVSISYEGNGVYAAPCDTGVTSTTAAPCETPPSTSSLIMYSNLIDGLNIILAVLSVLISPIILFVGWLMSPDWTSGDLFGLRIPMYSLWVTVSNIVYFVYAILLILIALGTMFGKESFSYKVMLPKLALGILMVPFTWWFVQWTISLASVVTASVISIPLETMNAIESQKPSIWFSKKESIPTNITIGSGATISSDCTKPGECITPKKFMESSAGMYGPMVVYAYSIFKFDKIQKLETGVDIAKAALNIVHTSIISVIMFAVFGILVLALAAMLLVRAIKLWVYAIFSPLFTFQFVAGSAMMGGDKDTFTIKEFVGLCFVPAIVGLALSFGLIIIAAIQGTNGAGGSTTPPCDLTQGCSILNIMGSPSNTIFRKWDLIIPNKDYITSTVFTWGPTTINFIGKASTQMDPMTTTVGTLDSLGGIFGTLIIDIIALVFIWMAFMAAKNVSKAVSMAVEPFENIGKQVGSLAKSIPKYTPIPGLGMSANSMAQVPRSIESALSTADSKRFENSGIGKLLNADKNISTDRDKKLVEAIKAGDKIMIEKMMKEDGSKEYMYKSESTKAFMDQLKGKTVAEQNAYLEKINIKDINQQKAIRDFVATGKNELKTDNEKKEFLTLINAGLGTGSGTGTNGGTGTSGTFVKSGVAGSESININIGGITKASIDVKTAKVTNLTDEVKKHLKENITEEDLRKSLNGLTLPDQEKIFAAMKDHLKPKA